MLDFPAAPAVNDRWTAPTGVIYVWDGTKWATVPGGGGGGAMVEPVGPGAYGRTETGLWNRTVVHGGDRMLGSLAINPPATAWPTVALEKAASGMGALVAGKLGLLDRWMIEVGNATPETGANAGSDFAISRFNDAGAYIDTPIFVNRSTGVLSLTQPPLVGGVALPYVAKAGDSMSGKLYMFVDGSVAGNASALEIQATNDALIAFHRPGSFACLMGLNTANAFTIGGWSMPVGAFQISAGGNLYSVGIITAVGEMQSYAGVWRAGNSSHYLQHDGNNGAWYLVDTGVVSLTVGIGETTARQHLGANYWFYVGRVYQGDYYLTGDGNYRQIVFGNSGQTTTFYQQNNGNYYFNVSNTTAFCFDWATGRLIDYRGAVGGYGAYENYSDAAIKTDIVPAALGMAAIRQLNPVAFTRLPPPMKGVIPPVVEPPVPMEPFADLPPQPETPAPNTDMPREIGFIAQEVQGVIPEAVSPMPWHDDTQILGLSIEPIVAALVNAMKEMDARLTAGGL